MATVTKPIALDESFHTTETPSRNIADVLASLGDAISQGAQPVTKKLATNVFKTINGGLVDGLTVQFTPIQDLHGYSKPWAGGAGKQKLDFSAVVGSNNGVTFSIADDGGIALTGTATSDVWQSANSNFTLTPGTTYAVNGLTATVRMRIREFDANNVALNELTVNNVESTFTVNANTVKLDAFIRIASGVATSGEVYPMIRLASIADPTFEPYSNICPISGHTQVQSKINNTTYTTSLGGTYYGGDVEQVGGTGKATYGSTDLGTASFTYYGDGLFGVSNNTIKPETHINIICSCYKSYEGINNVTGTSTAKAYMSDGDIASKEGSKEIFIKDTRYSDADVLKAALSGQSVAYELATPTALTLTGQNITAEVGENNVSAPLTGQSIKPDSVIYKDMFTWEDVLKVI